MSLADNGGDVVEPGALGGAPAALAHDEFEAITAKGADHDGLQQSHLGDRRGEFVERIIIKGAPGLSRVRRNRVDGYLLEIRPGHLPEHGVVGGRCYRSRTLLVVGETGCAWRRAGKIERVIRTGSRTAVSTWAWCFRDKCSEALAEASPLLRHDVSLLDCGALGLPV